MLLLQIAAASLEKCLLYRLSGQDEAFETCFVLGKLHNRHDKTSEVKKFRNFIRSKINF